MWGAPPPSEPVIVTTKTGQTIKGLLVERQDWGLLVRAAKLAGVDRNGAVEWNGLAGDVVIPADNVDYWQRAIDAQMVE